MTGQIIVVTHSDKKPILSGKLYHFRNTCTVINVLPVSRVHWPDPGLSGLLHVFH
jgi:nitrate reductase NapAB chaperone NapD